MAKTLNTVKQKSHKLVINCNASNSNKALYAIITNVGISVVKLIINRFTLIIQINNNNINLLAFKITFWKS